MVGAELLQLPAPQVPELWEAVQEEHGFARPPGNHVEFDPIHLDIVVIEHRIPPSATIDVKRNPVIMDS